MTATGKIQEWEIFVGKNDEQFYEIVYGQKDGKKIVNKTKIKCGKNIGKKNETTAEKQCELEAKSLWIKQKDRKGYTEEIPTEKPMMPMLAQNYEKHSSKIVWPCFVNKKLDGIRCIYRDGKLYSRQNTEFTTLTHLNKSLKNCQDVLDGELYSHELTFQEMVSIIKRDVRHPDYQKIKYYVYDVINSDDNEKRSELVSSLYYDHIIPVKYYECKSDQQLKDYHGQFTEAGYEGVILRNKKGLYKINGRSKDLQKYKHFLDFEFKIVDVINGKGKFEECGIYVCEHKSKTFPVTPKCTEDQKQKILINKNKYIGKMLNVRFFEWTTSDVPLPRFPVGIEVRDYE